MADCVRNRQHGMRGLSVFLCLGLVVPALAADSPVVSRLKTAVAPEVKEGFKVREEFWTGQAKAGARQLLKHQLFRGNEYWFWLAVGDTGPVPSLKVYDSKGRPVDVETKAEKGWIAVRLLPPRTGTYSVVFVFTAPEGVKDAGEEVAWAMTYGYR